MKRKGITIPEDPFSNAPNTNENQSKPQGKKEEGIFDIANKDVEKIVEKKKSNNLNTLDKKLLFMTKSLNDKATSSVYFTPENKKIADELASILDVNVSTLINNIFEKTINDYKKSISHQKQKKINDSFF